MVGTEQALPSDDDLVVGLGKRDEEALREIYRRHGAAVWSVARRVCRRPELAEEVSRAVFTQLWAHPEQFDPSRSALRSWLVAQAHSRSVDLVRNDDGNHASPTSATSTVVDVATHAEALPHTTRRALDRLPPAERDALLLTYFGGHAPEQTARLLGTLDGAVKSHIRSGLSNLRRTLEVEGVTR